MFQTSAPLSPVTQLVQSWDQESVESEPDALEGGEAMSDDSD